MESPNDQILVVDDDPGIREYLNLQLTSHGYQVLLADCAYSAIEVLKKEPSVDLILLDVIMPEISGFDLLKDIKTGSQYAHIPIIMVTALGLVEDKELAFRLGAADYLTKPFDSREMLARVRTHISLKQKSQELSLKNEMLTTILGTVPGIVYMKDNERKYIHINQHFLDVVGKRKEETIGKSDTDLFEEDIAEAFHRSEDLIFTFGLPFLENIEDINDINNDVRRFFFRRQPVNTPDGTLSGLVGVGIDITEQIELRSILSEREAFLSMLMNTFPAQIWAIGKDGLFKQQNSHHLEKWGNLIGKSIEDLQIDSNKKKNWIEQFQHALQGEIMNWTYTDLQEGKESTIAVWLLPILNGDEISGVMGISLNSSNASILKFSDTRTAEK